MYVCIEMYCDETTNAKNIPFGTNIPLDNRNRSTKWRRKNPPFWPPAAILNFWRPTFEKAITFESFEISTPDWRHFAQDWILLYSGYIQVLPLIISHPKNGRMLKHNKRENFRNVWPIYAKPASNVQGAIAINSISIMIGRQPPAAILILLQLHYNKTTEAMHFKLCTGMRYCYINRPAKRHCTT
jgi:hypothetical protein